MGRTDVSKVHDFALGFVTFNPEATFLDRLRLLSNHGFTTYVFDNSPESRFTAESCRSLPGVVYNTEGRNRGLGVGLAAVTSKCSEDGYEALLFFDQDTAFSKATLEYIGAVYATLSPDRLDRYVAIAFDGRSDKEHRAMQVSDELLVISSGSLFLLRNLQMIGWHNRTYFVDGVDYELCLRARVMGYRIGRCGWTPGFDHEAEQPDQIIEFLGYRLPVRRYSAGRIKDSVKAYTRLIGYTLRMMDVKASLVMARTLLIYMFGQVSARFVSKRTSAI